MKINSEGYIFLQEEIAVLNKAKNCWIIEIA